jgi:hypothetical protein
LSIFGIGFVLGLLVGWSVAHESREDYASQARKFGKRWGHKLNLDWSRRKYPTVPNAAPDDSASPASPLTGSMNDLLAPCAPISKLPRRCRGICQKQPREGADFRGRRRLRAAPPADHANPRTAHLDRPRAVETGGADLRRA